MRKFLISIFTWWNTQTLNTRFYTWYKGIKVGEDKKGNQYYQTSDAKRRWVIFNGEVEASKIGADWHGWLHHTYPKPPNDDPIIHQKWQKPHQENLTGNDLAYRPKGSLYLNRRFDYIDYQAWRPNVLKKNQK